MDQLLFHFQGGLADQNRMDFYEAARFQYAAARLSVKLDQFRRTGRFSKRVTESSRTNIGGDHTGARCCARHYGNSLAERNRRAAQEKR
jgi:hypothetical protein